MRPPDTCTQSFVLVLNIDLAGLAFLTRRLTSCVALKGACGPSTDDGPSIDITACTFTPQPQELCTAESFEKFVIRLGRFRVADWVISVYLIGRCTNNAHVLQIMNTAVNGYPKHMHCM